MNINAFKFTKSILLAITVVFAVFSSQAFARGFGGFRSFGRGFHFSVPARSLSWGGRSGSSAFRTIGRRGSGLFSKSVFSSSGAALSRADRALYRAAKTRGTLFSSRSKALNAFRRQYRDKYQNKFSARPAERPAYIPHTYSAPNGSRYSVVYRPDLGGYGYYNPSLGKWMLYSVMSDAAMTALLMRHNGYYYGPSPAYYGSQGSLPLGSIIFLVFIGIAVTRMANIRRGL